MMASVDSIDVGSVIAGKYVVERLLGKGGMGLVVAATHMELGELRAIKVLKPGLEHSADVTQRFLQEARAAAKLRSSYVVKVYDVGKLDDGSPFMVMEYLEGRDLAAVRSERTVLPVSDVILYAIQICDVLAEAHALGLVHRDLKPANLLLTNDGGETPCVKVLDFGVSKSVTINEQTDEMTTSGKIMGTPIFMPPEQMRGVRDIDARADLWALGVILYVLLTGRYPFAGAGAGAVGVMVRVLESTEPPAAPSNIRDEISPELSAVILRCLERDREKRFASAADVARALLPFAPEPASLLMPRILRSAEGQLTVRSTLPHDLVVSETVSEGSRGWAHAREKDTMREGPNERRQRRRRVVGFFALVALFGGLLATLTRVSHRRDDVVATAPADASYPSSVLGAPSATSLMPLPLPLALSAASTAAAPAASSSSSAVPSNWSSAAPSKPRTAPPEARSRLPPPVDKPNRYNF